MNDNYVNERKIQMKTSKCSLNRYSDNVSFERIEIKLKNEQKMNILAMEIQFGFETLSKWNYYEENLFVWTSEHQLINGKIETKEHYFSRWFKTSHNS